ncbi:MAG: ADP-ribosylglycohydrolase family protein [Clostridiales Family XIII bacterium]|nr:ADP-ribosylglycohydrolase family protein [Clostridiales Family XIII bacterium]
MRVSVSNYRGCLIGGGAADAMAYGIRDKSKNLLSDNTQMSIFTVDGLIWADDRAIKRGVYAYIPCLFYSYQKWYYTQTGNLADKDYDFILGGEILDWEQLFARRGTGETSMTALAGSIKNKYGTLKNRVNSSKGCGSVMRVAPIGLYFWKNEEMAFRIGMESGALTHGHIDAILSAGYYAAFVADIISGNRLEDAATNALERLKTYEGHEVVSAQIERAIEIAESGVPALKAMEGIGKGYTADEAAALAVFVSLRYKDDFDGAVLAATTFDGNTDSIAPIVGNALGARYGLDIIPQKWIGTLELHDLLAHGADVLLERVDIEDISGD